MIAGLAAAAQQLGYSVAAQVAWRWNPELKLRTLLECLRFTTNSVLYEEFLFRGYLLYQAIRFLGPKRGIVLSAGAFGIYHWFSYGVLGNIPAMLYVFLLTGSFGAMGALLFARTHSMAAPIGLHLGWNVVTYAIFSAGPSGRVLLIPGNGAAHLQLNGWEGLLLGLILPLAFIAAVMARPYRTSVKSVPVAEQTKA
jgi:hypothetical protein